MELNPDWALPSAHFLESCFIKLFLSIFVFLPHISFFFLTRLYGQFPSPQILSILNSFKVTDLSPGSLLNIHSHYESSNHVYLKVAK